MIFEPSFNDNQNIVQKALGGLSPNKFIFGILLEFRWLVNVSVEACFEAVDVGQITANYVQIAGVTCFRGFFKLM